MPLNKFTLKDQDLEAFGKLMKDWARGIKPLPANKAEFIAALDALGIKPNWPTGANIINTVIVQQVPLGTLHLLVAPAKLIDESEAFLSQPGAVYPLPDYYKNLAFQVDHVIAHLLRFNDARTADYTVSHCT